MSEPTARPNSLSAECEWVNVDAKEGAEESEVASGIDKASQGDNSEELLKAQAQAHEMKEIKERFVEMERRCARAEEAEKRYSELLRKKEEEVSEGSDTISHCNTEATAQGWPVCLL